MYKAVTAQAEYHAINASLGSLNMSVCIFDQELYLSKREVVSKAVTTLALLEVL
jgi:hypothetical protein